MQTCYECNGQQLTFDEDEHLSDDPQPECEILATTKTMREEKNCERKREFKETMSTTKLEGGDLVMMEGVKLICRFGNREGVTMNNDHPVQIQQTLNQSFRFLTNL